MLEMDEESVSLFRPFSVQVTAQVDRGETSDMTLYPTKVCGLWAILLVVKGITSFYITF